MQVTSPFQMSFFIIFLFHSKRLVDCRYKSQMQICRRCWHRFWHQSRIKKVCIGSYEHSKLEISKSIYVYIYVGHRFSKSIYVGHRFSKSIYAGHHFSKSIYLGHHFSKSIYVGIASARVYMPGIVSPKAYMLGIVSLRVYMLGIVSARV